MGAGSQVGKARFTGEGQFNQLEKHSIVENSERATRVMTCSPVHEHRPVHLCLNDPMTTMWEYYCVKPCSHCIVVHVFLASQ